MILKFLLMFVLDSDRVDRPLRRAMLILLGSADIILASSAERSIHRVMPARPSSAQGACAPKNYSGRRDACEDLGIAADTAASTPKIKH